MQNANFYRLESAKNAAAKRTDELRFARMLARIKPEIDAIEKRRTERRILKEIKDRKLRTAILLTGGCFVASTIGVVVGLCIYLGTQDGFYSRSVSAYKAIVASERTRNSQIDQPPHLTQPAPLAVAPTPAVLSASEPGGAVKAPETEVPVNATTLTQNTVPVQVTVPVPAPAKSVNVPAKAALPVAVIQKPVQETQKVPTENSIDVVLKARPRPVQEYPVAIQPKSTAPEVIPFEVTAYMDGFVMVRQGSKVSAVKIGEILPDGKTLTSVSNNSYKSTPK